MERAIRILNFALIALAVALGLVLAVFLVLTSTEWGLERVRDTIVGQLEERVEGEVRVERITARRLLAGATFHGVSIDDPRGRPFLRIDSISARYHWRTLLAGDLIFDRVTAYRPIVVLEKLPVDTVWNFDLVFPPGVPAPERRFILFERARLVDGEVVVRTPWEPEPPVAPADTARMLLVEAPGGLVREFRFEAVHAALPRVLWESPDEIGQAFEVSSLATRGFVWEDPFLLRDLRGTVTRRDSLVSFDVPYFELPESRASAIGRIITDDPWPYLDVRIESPEVVFRDLHWLYPPLPDEGGGRLVFRIQSQDPAGILWYASDAHIRAPGTELAGNFGIVTGDTLYFTEVNLRASPLNLDLLDRILPVDLPVDGLLVGTVIVEGPLSSLVSEADLRLAANGGSEAAVRWSGTLDLRSPYAVQGLHADVRRLDLDLLAPFAPESDLRGRVGGLVSASGRLDRDLRFSALLTHELDGHTPSYVEAEGTVTRRPDGAWLDAVVQGAPFNLDGLAASFGGARHKRPHGEVSGPLRVSGPLSDLEIMAELQTASGGLAFTGSVDPRAARPRYRGAGRLSSFRLDEALPGLPETRVSGEFTFDAEGTSPEDLRGGFGFVIEEAEIDGVVLHGARVRLSVADGVARLDTLEARGPAGRLTGRGSFALAADASGTLELELVADSLSALRERFFPDAVPVWNGDGGPPELAGRLTARARLEGGVSRFRAMGDATLEELVFDRIGVRSARADFTAAFVAGQGIAVDLSADADSVDLYGRPLTTAWLEARYGPDGEGELRLEAAGPPRQRYAGAAAFRLDDGSAELDLAELDFLAAGSAWRLSAPARLRVGAAGLELDTLQLGREDGAGRLTATGRLPWVEGPGRAAADFSLEIEDLPAADFLRIAHPGSLLDGTVAGRVRVTGDAAAPSMEADLAIADFRYDDVRIDRLRGHFAYRDRRLQAHVEALHDERPVLTARGRLPVDLALRPVERRWVAEPLTFIIEAAGVPARLPMALMEGFERIEGSIDGTLEVGGTVEEPTLGGTLVLTDGAAYWRDMGVRYRDVQGTFRFLGRDVMETDARFRAGPGRGAVSGTLTFRPLRDPEFDLLLQAQELEAARRRELELVGTGELRLRGRYTRPRVTGGLRVDRGVLHLDELVRQQQVVELGAPFLFEVVDTTVLSVRQILPASENPFLRNLLVDASVAAGRDVWLRGRDLNAEVSGDMTVGFDRRTEDLRIFGALTVVRGHYLLYGRRFEVRRGTVEFAGNPGINPALDIVAGYRARTMDGDPLDIRAVVSGSLEHPRVHLTSDIEPPISQSDLASYLVFGRPTYALAPGETRALATGVQLGVGVMAPTFLGYAASGLELVAAENLGLDYLSITPDVTTSEYAMGGAAFLTGSQLEIGRYVADNVFLAFTERLGLGSRDVRLEWRFRPTWTAELFAEDRFARAPTFGRTEPFEFRSVYGFFLFRDWGY